MTTSQSKNKAPSAKGAGADGGRIADQQQRQYTTLEWFFQYGGRFVRVAAKDKKPFETGWQNKPLGLKDVLPHVKSGGNVGLLCGKHSGGLCLLDLDDNLNEFLEYFPGLLDAPIIKRKDAPNRGKLVLQITGDIPNNMKPKGIHLEFLGTGNQGVIPPSIHPSGAAYELSNAGQGPLVCEADRLIRICEIWKDVLADSNILAAVEPLPVAQDSGRGRPSRQTKDFIEFGAGEGTRNKRLFTAACDLCGCRYSEDEAELMLFPAGQKSGLNEKEIRATIKSAYKQNRQPANPHAFSAVHSGVKADKAVQEREVIYDDASEDQQPFPVKAPMPELPKAARLTDSEIKQGRKTGKFIDDYMAFGLKDAPMTPPLFHQTYALAILSTAIARRVFVNAGGGTNIIYPNLYILLSAPSTLYTKTTGYKSAKKILDSAGLSHLLLPEGVTPQSLITELSNRPQENFQNWSKDDKEEWQKEKLFSAQRAWWMDEAASMLSWFQQKHLAELKNIILRFYECEPKMKVSTQARGRETVRNIYLTICGPTTPAALRPHLKTPAYWGEGLFARFLLVTPDTAPVRVFFPEPFQIPPALIKHINQLMFEKLETPKETVIGETPAPPTIEAKIAPEVKRRWDKYHEAMFEIINKRSVSEKLHASYGRFPEKAIKISILLAASDWVRMAKGNPLVVSEAHWFRAQEITEGYRASLHRMIDDASQPIDSEDSELAEKIIARLQTSSRNSRRELAQDLNMRAGAQREHLEMILNQLIRDGVLVEKEIRKERGPGTVRLYVNVTDRS